MLYCHKSWCNLLIRQGSKPWLGYAHMRDPLFVDRLVCLVVKASAYRVEDPGFESRWRRNFSGSSHTSDLNIGT